MASLLLVHGVASPGFIVEMNGVVALTGAATLPVGAVILALSALPATRSPRAVTPLLWLQAALMVGVVGLGLAALWLPELVPSVPEPASLPAIAMLVVGLALLRPARAARAAHRAADAAARRPRRLRRARLARRRARPRSAAELLDLAWWLGHGLEVAGVLLVGAPVAADLFRSSPSRPLAGDLRGAEMVSAEEAFLGSQVGGLVRLLAERTSTPRGTRAASRCWRSRWGRSSGCQPARLRELATGGLLHDIGKLSVPDEVLKKPGALDDVEYASSRSTRLGRRAPRPARLLVRIRRLVRDHHERLDGTGYPHGATALSLETRVLAVCDVYDALRSDRVYREAWVHERAIALLREEAGTKFDAKCVEALSSVLARQAARAAWSRSETAWLTQSMIRSRSCRASDSQSRSYGLHARSSSRTDALRSGPSRRRCRS